MNKRTNTLIFLCFSLLMVGCSKKDYFKDTGLQKGSFNGTVMQYLESKPEYFDSLVKVIKLAGMETQLNAPGITFFAPADSSIRLSLRMANIQLDLLGKPRVNALTDISPEIWKKHLSKYLFKFKRSLNDFVQIDFGNINTYGGQMYESAGGLSMNIGAVYTDVQIPTKSDPTKFNVIKYAGYRYLTISYLTSPFTPRDVGTWRVATVSTVNIQPTNGYIHLIRFSDHAFGFSDTEFSNDVAYFNNK